MPPLYIGAMPGAVACAVELVSGDSIIVLHCVI